MILEPLPKLLQEKYDKDSLIYKDDTSLYYNTEVDEELIEEIKSKNLQVYSGYYDYSRGWDSPKIYLIGRGNNIGKFKIKIQGFKPYCYIKNSKGEYKSYLGDTVQKLEFESHPSKIKQFRELRRRKGFSIPYEADILFVRRFLLDMYDYFKPTTLVEPNVAIVDVETNHPVSDEIISFSINDMKNPIIYESKYDVNSNYELALDLYNEVCDYDVITGWNVEFDINMLDDMLHKINRLLNIARKNRNTTKENYIEFYVNEGLFDEQTTRNLINNLIEYGYLKLLDDKVVIGERQFKSNNSPRNKFKSCITENVAVIDLLSISKKMHAREIRGKWSLDNVGIQICGMGKMHTGATRIGDMDAEELMEYNVNDVIIPEIIDSVLGGLEGHLILSWSLQCLLEDTKITAVVNDIALLRAYHKAGIVLPSRHWDEKGDEVKYKAAEPDARPGVYEGISALDLKHAYPSAVISKNISPETKDPNGIYEAPNGIRFNTSHSVFIDTLKEIMDERGKIKEKMKGVSSQSDEWKRLKSIDFALKTQAAAFSHGIFGWSNSRMRDYEVADAITSVVRGIIDKIKETCDNINKPWVYCHTDSAYVKVDKQCLEKTINFLNNTIAEMFKGDRIAPILEKKGYYKVGYIHSAARNVLIPEDGDINDDETWEVTGMNFMRSEVAEELRDIEIDMIKNKLKGLDDNSLKDILRERIKNLKNVDSTKLGLIKPLNKPPDQYGRQLKDGSIGGFPYHIKAIFKAQEEFGFEVNVGDKYMILPIMTDETTGVRKIRRKRIEIAFPIETGLPDGYDIDYVYYLRSNLWGKLHQLFDIAPKDLEKEIMTDEIKDMLGGN